MQNPLLKKLRKCWNCSSKIYYYEANNLKERLDVILVNKGLFDSRSAAAASIMAGVVFVNGQREDKAGKKFEESDETLDISIAKDICPYVGRGGLKLEGAANEFDISLHNNVTVDIGASTGGFTDYMLQNGASKVYAVDVGYGQLDWKLRNDDRVVNLERTNIRHLTDEQIPELVDFITIDVSFISLKLVFPVASRLLKEDGQIVALVKPQFEAGKNQVGKKGIVRDLAVHKEVIENVIEYAHDNDLFATNLTQSQITGAKGNQEYLILLKKRLGSNDVELNIDKIDEVINR